MCNYEMNFTFFSSKNLAIGSKLRESFRKLGLEISYCSTIQELVDSLSVNPNKLLFFAKEHAGYAKFLSQVLNSNLGATRYCRVAFVDDDFQTYAPYVNNLNFFCIPTTNMEPALYTLITKCELLGTTAPDYFSFKEVSQKISYYLTKLGFSYKLMGFKYLKESIEQVVRNNFNIGSLTNDIYPQIAILNQTSKSNVERSIRTAIDNAYAKSKFDIEGFEAICSPKISNRFFISFIADKLVNEINSEVC